MNHESKLSIIIFILMFLTFSSLTYAAILADMRTPTSTDSCRRDMGVAMMMALFPPIWIVVPFLTGFYENGLQFTCSE